MKFARVDHTDKQVVLHNKDCQVFYKERLNKKTSIWLIINRHNVAQIHYRYENYYFRKCNRC